MQNPEFRILQQKITKKTKGRPKVQTSLSLALTLSLGRGNYSVLYNRPRTRGYLMVPALGPRLKFGAHISKGTVTFSARRCS